jgi:Fungal protein kinase
VSITSPLFISELSLVLGHRHLWNGGIEHNDISVSNMIYDKTKNGDGVLNDFDLAHVRGKTRPSGTGRTGTMPFMALDLLTKNAWAGKVERLYRHDCESFVWVLLWICSRYDEGAEIEQPPLKEFITSNFLQHYKEKRSFGQTFAEIKHIASYRDYWLPRTK